MECPHCHTEFEKPLPRRHLRTKYEDFGGSFAYCGMSVTKGTELVLVDTIVETNCKACKNRFEKNQGRKTPEKIGG